MLRKFLLTFYLLCQIYYLLPSYSYAGEPGFNLSNSTNIPGSFQWVFYTPESPDKISQINSFSAPNIVLRLHANWTSTGQQMLRNPAKMAVEWANEINKYASKVKYVEPFNELEVNGERDGLSVEDAVKQAVIFISVLKNNLNPSITVTSPGLSNNLENGPTVIKAFTDNGMPISSFDVISWHAYVTPGDNDNEALNYQHLADLNVNLSGKKFLITEFGVKDSGPIGAIYTDCAFIWYLCHNPTNNIAAFWQKQSDIIAYFQWTIAPFSGSWKLNSTSDVLPANQNQCSGLSIPSDPKSANCRNTVYNAMPHTKDYVGGADGCENITAADLAPSPWWLTWFRVASIAKKLKCYLVNSSWNYGTTVADPCGSAGKPTAEFINPENRVKFINPSNSLTAFVNSIERNPDSEPYRFGGAGLSNSYAATTENNAAPNFPFFADLNGAGGAASSVRNQKTMDEFKRTINDFDSGSLPRMTAYQDHNDIAVKQWLCVLAKSAADISSTANACISGEPFNVLDYQIGFLNDLTNEAYSIALPKAASVLPDRTKTEAGYTDIMVKASDLYCALKFPCNVSELEVGGGRSAPVNAKCDQAVPLSPPANLNDCAINSTSLTPDQQIFCVAWSKLRIAILDNKMNVPSAGFNEVCTESPGNQDWSVCGGAVAKSQKVPFCSKYHFLDLLDHPEFCEEKPTGGYYTPDDILNDFGGRYVLLADGICQTCQVTKVLFPSLAQAKAANLALGCGLATKEDTHAVANNTKNVFDMTNSNEPLDDSYTPNSLGINNNANIINVENFSWNIGAILTNIFGNLKKPECPSNSPLRSHIENLEINGVFQDVEIFENACEATVPIKVQTILWTNKDTQIAYNCSLNLNNSLMSESTIQAVNALPPTKIGYKADYVTDNCATPLGAREMSMPGAAKISGGCGDDNSNKQTLIEYMGDNDIPRSGVRSNLFLQQSEIDKQTSL